MEVNKLKAYILLLRPKQWIKNFFVFAALLFSGNISKPAYITAATEAFAVFCLTSSAVYIFNDLMDIERDRKHPRKKNRPLASGVLGKREAAVLLLLLLPSAVYAAFRINTSFGTAVVLYLLNNLLYTLYIKHLVILDVMSIAVGFILRVAGGALAISVEISPWLLLCTLLLALFLGFSKRRNELVILQEDAQSHRTILEHYSLSFIDNMLSIVTASTVISYSMYTFFANENKYSMVTILFVLYGIFRYQYIIYNKNMGESPEEVVLTDKPLLINIILWIIASIIIIY
jgi:4-hydroxybenzoate polyprenyltransferase